MVDLGSLVLLTSVFGARVAVLYVALGLVVAVAAAPSFKNWAWSGMWSRSSWRRAAWTSRCRT